MSDDISKQRLVNNEEMFKRKNEEAQRILRHVLPPDEPISFVCECSNEDCLERIDLLPADYQQLHSDDRLYVIKPDHQTPTVEEVVDKTNDYYVVKKLIPHSRHRL